MVKEVNINYDDLNNGSYSTYHIYETINIDNFYKIIDVDLEFKEASYNIYSRNVVLKGTYIGNGRGIYSLDWCGVDAELLVR